MRLREGEQVATLAPVVGAEDVDDVGEPPSGDPLPESQLEADEPQD
jgi:hypothetical protein